MSSNEYSIHAAIKSFVGFLEGTQKSAHTIESYRSDLSTFRRFIDHEMAPRPVSLHELQTSDLEKYHDYLRSQHLKTNTRRRKLLTVRRLFRYLTVRKKLTIDISAKLPAPTKIERIAQQLDFTALMKVIRGLPADHAIYQRNRALLWTLLETGCQVSEVTRIRKDDVGEKTISITGKAARSIPVSTELCTELKSLTADPWLFFGFNKYGPLKAAVTPRGVELLVRVYAKRLGVSGLTPRLFRKAAVLEWYAQGLSRADLQARLGLKTDYAFKSYEPLFKKISKAHPKFQPKSKTKTTSTDEMPPTE